MVELTEEERKLYLKKKKEQIERELNDLDKNK